MGDAGIIPVGYTGSQALGGNVPTLSFVDAAGSSSFKLYVVDMFEHLCRQLGPLSLILVRREMLMLHTDGNINGTGFLFEVAGQTVPRFQAGQLIQLRNSTIANSAAEEVDLAGVVSGHGWRELRERIGRLRSRRLFQL